MVLLLWTKLVQRREDERLYQMRLMLMQTDFFGKIMCGKDWTANLTEEFDREVNKTDNSDTSTPLSETLDDQKIMEQKLRAIGIPIREV